jgi:hypothetical protein
MTLEELKQKNPRAYRSLILFWAELSRISELEAKNDIEDDLGDRYFIDDEDLLYFIDTHAGDSFYYDEEVDKWHFY